MHDNYLYDLWPPWLDLTLHLHEMPGQVSGNDGESGGKKAV